MGHQVTVHLGFPITSWVSLNLLRRPQPEAVAVGGARPVQDQGAREPLARPPRAARRPSPSPLQWEDGVPRTQREVEGTPPPPPRPAGRRGQSAHHAERDRRLHRSRGPEWRGAGRRGRLSTGQSCAWRAWSFARCERNGGWWRERTRMSRRRAAAWPSGQRPGGTGWRTDQRWRGPGCCPSRRTREWEPHAKGSALHAAASAQEAPKPGRQPASASWCRRPSPSAPPPPPRTRNKDTRA